LLIVIELYPAWGTSPGTKIVKLVPSLYYQFEAFGNDSVVPIFPKTKALGVLGAQLERFRHLDSSGFASINPETGAP
jgi:hypothetical protein